MRICQKPTFYDILSKMKENLNGYYAEKAVATFLNKKCFFYDVVNALCFKIIDSF